MMILLLWYTFHWWSFASHNVDWYFMQLITHTAIIVDSGRCCPGLVKICSMLKICKDFPIMTIIINNDVTYYNEIKAHYQFIILLHLSSFIIILRYFRHITLLNYVSTRLIPMKMCWNNAWAPAFLINDFRFMLSQLSREIRPREIHSCDNTKPASFKNIG